MAPSCVAAAIELMYAHKIKCSAYRYTHTNAHICENSAMKNPLIKKQCASNWLNVSGKVKEKNIYELYE